MSDSQAALRKRARLARESFGHENAASASRAIAKSVVNMSAFASAKTVASYLAMPGEVDTSEIIECAWLRKTRVFLPVTGKDNSMIFREHTPSSALVRSNLGIEEPVNGAEIETSEIDFIVVPLVAFDKDGNRIGMGGGYYDRAFSFLRKSDAGKNNLLVGVAFDCQMVEKIAPNPWDIPLSCIVTETSILSR